MGLSCRPPRVNIQENARALGSGSMSPLQPGQQRRIGQATGPTVKLRPIRARTVQFSGNSDRKCRFIEGGLPADAAAGLPTVAGRVPTSRRGLAVPTR
jgi:hypothetical protein